MSKKLLKFFPFLFISFQLMSQSNTYYSNKKFIDSLRSSYNYFDCYEIKKNNIPKSLTDVDIQLLEIFNKAIYIHSFPDVLDFVEKNEFNDLHKPHYAEIDSLLNEVIFSKQTIDTLYGNIKILLFAIYNRVNHKLESCTIKFATNSRFGCYFLYEGKVSFIDNFIDFEYVEEKLLRYIKWPLSLGQDKSTLDINLPLQ